MRPWCVLALLLAAAAVQGELLPDTCMLTTSSPSACSREPVGLPGRRTAQQMCWLCGSCCLGGNRRKPPSQRRSVTGGLVQLATGVEQEVQWAPVSRRASVQAPNTRLGSIKPPPNPVATGTGGELALYLLCLCPLARLQGMNYAPLETTEGDTVKLTWTGAPALPRAGASAYTAVPGYARPPPQPCHDQPALPCTHALCPRPACKLPPPPPGMHGVWKLPSMECPEQWMENEQYTELVAPKDGEAVLAQRPLHLSQTIPCRSMRHMHCQHLQAASGPGPVATTPRAT